MSCKNLNLAFYSYLRTSLVNWLIPSQCNGRESWCGYPQSTCHLRWKRIITVFLPISTSFITKDLRIGPSIAGRHVSDQWLYKATESWAFLALGINFKNRQHNSRTFSINMKEKGQQDSPWQQGIPNNGRHFSQEGLNLLRVLSRFLVWPRPPTKANHELLIGPSVLAYCPYLTLNKTYSSKCGAPRGWVERLRGWQFLSTFYEWTGNSHITQ